MQNTVWTHVRVRSLPNEACYELTRGDRRGRMARTETETARRIEELRRGGTQREDRGRGSARRSKAAAKSTKASKVSSSLLRYGPRANIPVLRAEPHRHELLP